MNDFKVIHDAIVSGKIAIEELEKEMQVLPTENGEVENTIVQKGSNAVTFGENSTAFGTSSTNAKDRGITEESTSEEILQEWTSSDPEDQKFALTLGEGSHIEGNNCLALGKNSHAEGNGTAATNNSSHSEGTGTIASGKYAHAEGLETQAIGERAHAEGQETIATGKQSHAEGKHTMAYANGSHAEGLVEPFVERESFNDRIKSGANENALYQTLEFDTAAEQYEVGYILWKISEDGVTWEDVRNQNIKVVEVYTGTSKWFKLSKKLGIGNKATRYAAFITSETDLYIPNATGEYSHTEGVSTQTNNRGEHAEGTYNKSNTGTISSIGIGTDHNDRKNAFEVMQNGDAYLYGVGGYNGTLVGGSIQSLQNILNLLIGDFNANAQTLKDTGVNISESDAENLRNKWILRVDRGYGIEVMHRVETVFSIATAYGLIESKGYSDFRILGVWGYEVGYTDEELDEIIGVILFEKEGTYTMLSFAI